MTNRNQNYRKKGRYRNLGKRNNVDVAYVERKLSFATDPYTELLEKYEQEGTSFKEKIYTFFFNECAARGIKAHYPVHILQKTANKRILTKNRHVIPCNETYALDQVNLISAPKKCLEAYGELDILHRMDVLYYPEDE